MNSHSPENVLAPVLPALLPSSSSSSSSAAGQGASSKPISKLGPAGTWPFRSSHNISNHREVNHFPSIITWYLCVVLMLTAVVYSLIWEIPVGLEDQLCSAKKWEYPTCLPRAGEILQHIPTPEEWAQYRTAYKRAVLTPVHFSMEPINWTNGSATGFAVPVRVEHHEGRGRGLYASTYIPKGTKVWDNRYSARMFDECEGKRFVQELTNDQACNAIMWGYSADHGTGMLEWGVDLDPCSFINKANSHSEANVVDRVVDLDKALVPGGHSMWTLRDILEGEELLSSYDGIRSANPMKNLLWHVKSAYMSWGLGPFLY